MMIEMCILSGEALKAQNILGAVRQNIFIGNNDIIDQGSRGSDAALVPILQFSY